MKITKWLFDSRFLVERTLAKSNPNLKEQDIIDYMFAAAHYEAKRYRK